MNNNNEKLPEIKEEVIIVNNNTHKKGKMRNSFFSNNKKYFTISMYAIFVILISMIIWKTIGDSDLSKKHLDKFFSIMSPFIVGAFIAFLLNPMVNYFSDTFFTKYIHIKKRKLNILLSILCTYVLFFGLIAILLTYVIPQIISSLKDLATLIPNWYSSIEKYILDFQKDHPDLNIDYDKLYKEIQDRNIIQTYINKISNLIPNIVSFVFTTSVTIIKFIFNLLISIIVSIYLISDKKQLIFAFKRFLYAIFPKKATEVIVDILKETNSIFSGFIFGKAVDSLIIGIICFICMSILKLDYAVLISVLVGITNMIPYFGPYIGGAFGMVILLISSPVKAIIFLVLIIAIQQFDGLFLGPKILGKSIGMRPIWIIFSITVGGSLYGVIGMFLGVPVFAVISYIFNRFLSYKLNKKHLDFDKNVTDLSHHINTLENNEQ